MQFLPKSKCCRNTTLACCANCKHQWEPERYFDIVGSQGISGPYDSLQSAINRAIETLRGFRNQNGHSSIIERGTNVIWYCITKKMDVLDENIKVIRLV